MTDYARNYEGWIFGVSSVERTIMPSKLVRSTAIGIEESP